MVALNFEELKHFILPESIRIGGVDYRLNLIEDYAFLNDDKTQSNDGEFDVNRGIIKLATTLRDTKQLIDRERTYTVLLHEILHGIVYHYVGENFDNEEHIVTQFAKGLYQVLKENPRLVKLFIDDNIYDYTNK